MEKIALNEKEFEVIRLLGKGKGGYSYLVTDGAGEAQKQGDNNTDQNADKGGYHPKTSSAAEFAGQIQPACAKQGAKNCNDSGNNLQYRPPQSGTYQI